MDKDHLITLDHQKVSCLYCNNNLSSQRWDSAWMSDKHYKTISCSCGHLAFLPVGFIGSGHDKWDGKEEGIEKVIKEAQASMIVKENITSGEIKVLRRFGKFKG